MKIKVRNAFLICLTTFIAFSCSHDVESNYSSIKIVLPSSASRSALSSEASYTLTIEGDYSASVSGSTSGTIEVKEIPTNSSITVSLKLTMESVIYRGSYGPFTIKTGKNAVSLNLSQVKAILAPDGEYYYTIAEAVSAVSEKIDSGELEEDYYTYSLVDDYIATGKSYFYASYAPYSILLDLGGNTLTWNSNFALVTPYSETTFAIENGIINTTASNSRPLIYVPYESCTVALKDVEIYGLNYTGTGSSVLYMAPASSSDATSFNSTVYLEDVYIHDCVSYDTTSAPPTDKGAIGIVNASLYAKNSIIENCEGYYTNGLFVYQSDVVWLGGYINMSTPPGSTNISQTASCLYVTGASSDGYDNVYFYGTTLYSNSTYYGKEELPAVTLKSFGHLNLSDGFISYSEFDFDSFSVKDYSDKTDYFVSSDNSYISGAKILSGNTDAETGDYETIVACGTSTWNGSDEVTADDSLCAIALLSSDSPSTLHIADNTGVGGFITPSLYSAIQITGKITSDYQFAVYLTEDVFSSYTGSASSGLYPIYGNSTIGGISDYFATDAKDADLTKIVLFTYDESYGTIYWYWTITDYTENETKYIVASPAH